MKEKYKKPIITLASIQIEECIVAQSAFIKPQTASDVRTEWDTDVTETKTFSWE